MHQDTSRGKTNVLMCSGIPNHTSANSLWCLSLPRARRPHGTVRHPSVIPTPQTNNTHLPSQGRIPADAFEGEERVALSKRDQEIRDELAAHDDKLNARMDEDMRRRLENDRKNVSGGGTTEEVVERDSPGP